MVAYANEAKWALKVWPAVCLGRILADLTFYCTTAVAAGEERLLLAPEAWKPVGLLSTAQCRGGPAKVSDQVPSTSSPVWRNPTSEEYADEPAF